MFIRLALLASVAILPGLAHAQSYNRIVTFGDSLSDNGNIFAATRGGTPTSPPYFQGRFSNGPVWVELLNGGMLRGATLAPGAATGSSNVNLAFGGARTDNLVALPPGTGTQIGLFLQTGGRLQSGDLVTIWGGANEFIQRAQLPINPATIQGEVGTLMGGAAANIGGQINTLARAGAGTIVTANLPDLGAAPAFAGGPAGPLANFASLAYNSAWASATSAAAAANPTTNIIQLPVDQLFAAVIAAPGRYGFSNVTAQCLTTAACVSGSPSTQAGYLFWDGVHPTAAGHALMANFAREHIFAPSRTAAYGILPEVGLWSRRQGVTDMMDRLSVAAPGAKPEFFVSVIGEQGERNVSLTRGGFANTGTWQYAATSARYAAGGLRFGGFANIAPAWVVGYGISGTVGDGKSGNVSFTPISFSADLVAKWSSGPVFVNLGAGAGINHYADIERQTLIAGEKNKTSVSGPAASAVVEAGYRFDMGSFGIIPKARLVYIWSQVGGMAETGLVAPVRFSSRSAEGLAAGAEVRFEGRFGSTLAHAVIGYEDFVTASASTLRGRLINNTAQPFVTTMRDPVGAGLLLGAGLDVTFGSWKAGAIYRATVGTKSQVTHRGSVTVGTTF